MRNGKGGRGRSILHFLEPLYRSGMHNCLLWMRESERREMLVGGPGGLQPAYDLVSEANASTTGISCVGLAHMQANVSPHAGI